MKKIPLYLSVFFLVFISCSTFRFKNWQDFNRINSAATSIPQIEVKIIDSINSIEKEIEPGEKYDFGSGIPANTVLGHIKIINGGDAVLKVSHLFFSTYVDASYDYGGQSLELDPDENYQIEVTKEIVGTLDLIVVIYSDSNDDEAFKLTIYSGP